MKEKWQNYLISESEVVKRVYRPREGHVLNAV